MPYDTHALGLSAEAMRLQLLLAHETQLEGAKELAQAIVQAIESTSLAQVQMRGEADDVVIDINSTKAKRKGNLGSLAFLRVVFEPSMKAQGSWSLAWFWTNRQEVGDTTKQPVPLVYDYKARRFVGPGGVDGASFLLDTITAKMMSERSL